MQGFTVLWVMFPDIFLICKLVYLSSSYIYLYIYTYTRAIIEKFANLTFVWKNVDTLFSYTTVCSFKIQYAANG